MKSLELLGCLLIANGIGVVAWWLMTGKPNSGYAILLCLIIVFVGLVFVFNERISEITIKNVGSIKTAAQQATGDANEIANLRKRIENQAATVDLVAGKASEAERLSKDLSKKNEIADRKLGEIEATLKQAEENVAKLDAIAEFTSTVVAAQNDDRRAFIQLEKWADDPSNPFAARARQAFQSIMNSFSTLLRTSYQMPSRPGVDLDKKTLDDLRQEFSQSSRQEIKRALLQYISRRNDIPTKDKLQWLADV